MSLVVVLVFVCLVLTVAEAMGKVPGWAVDFAMCVTMLVAFWGHGQGG